ncbi:hypothetical protein [Mongoliimonas terrestris]|uniref:hypothetical protein n=1 Tax=Mongoliimonas terrestris TaxID=1709001 RepID=UPI0009495816|nr:hypothetical protein [Mongoliimonas terrestris]
MEEEIVFHFDGALSSDHKMNFYEAARFQYAAARLLVKLDQFRKRGRFTDKVTVRSNQEIFLKPHGDGSFDIFALAPLMAMAGDYFVNVTMQNMLAYVFDRVIGKSSDSDVANSLNEVRQIVDAVGRINDNDSENMSRALSIIQHDQALKQGLTANVIENYERRIAELERSRSVAAKADELSKISSEQEQKLLSMSAPLASEMAKVLRRSATSLEIRTRSPVYLESKIVYLNREMASEIESATVDERMRVVSCDIIQYNKETGWGKARIADEQKPLSFSVPSDMKSMLQGALLNYMNKEIVLLQCYMVRDKVNTVTRMIVVGLAPVPTKIG